MSPASSKVFPIAEIASWTELALTCCPHPRFPQCVHLRKACMIAIWSSHGVFCKYGSQYWLGGKSTSGASNGCAAGCLQPPCHWRCGGLQHRWQRSHKLPCGSGNRELNFVRNYLLAGYGAKEQEEKSAMVF